MYDEVKMSLSTHFYGGVCVKHARGFPGFRPLQARSSGGRSGSGQATMLAVLIAQQWWRRGSPCVKKQFRMHAENDPTGLEEADL